jgi:hypothetical protein
MAVHSSTINWDNLNATTTQKIMPKVVDNIFRSNALYQRLRRRNETQDGGTFLAQPLLYGEGPGGAYSGTEVLDTSEAEQITTANFAWKFYYGSATIRRQDELRNRGKPAMAKIIRVKMQTMQKTMANLLGQGLYSDGSSNTKLITGLRAMVTGTGTTYGGISKTTNTWWRAPIDSTTTTLSISSMRSAVGGATEDREKPNMVMTTQALYDIYYGLLQPHQRFADARMARGGFTSILFEGIPVVVDSHCPANFIYYLNTDYIHFISHPAENMRMEPFAKPVNQPQLRTAFVMWAGNLTGSNCRFQTVQSAVTN